ncbi:MULTISPECIES: dephospho-CoA kinase [Thalassolituus]|uniref:dephospho-CoA kinase n=1 Tax=Thalassolituus TaxID=187492 RepID=UPI000C5670DC|nr:MULTISPECIES: dephospho-CoA kinase [Thalassolituus]MAG43564.1 dephospho-CoA kinase [Oceanospirillaceae bacterium]MAX86059.1 dephospho-CoA kinase [Oceanospirillaceae bacterium]|tara:strand:- start:1332 stop:1922 length:591 start_codon:yes stop_codon:yes gene_type:complete
MFILGLTGGIGSGKSAASAYFRNQGIVVVDADIVAREVVEPGQPALLAIKQRYGSEALHDDGTLNRAWLRAKVFAEPDERKWLESQTHPRIRDSIIAQLKAATSPYAILESPLLFESGQSELVARTLVIDVPEEIQVERASSRDGNEEEQIRRIIAAQIPRSERLQRADDAVDNSGNLEALYSQLEPLHQSYLQLT